MFAQLSPRWEMCRNCHLHSGVFYLAVLQHIQSQVKICVRLVLCQVLHEVNLGPVYVNTFTDTLGLCQKT